ncbi:MAG TPA: alpha/beta hydrolase [Jatrophihabitans sp.]|jgi:pimeloyl-ACP methyl ester carboxylesterase
MSTEAFRDHQPEQVTFAAADGLRLAGDRWTPEGGVRGTAVLLHGGGQTRHSWRATARRLAHDGWTAITYDARGHGDSEWASDGNYSLTAFVDDLYAVIHTLPEPPALIGASLGGMTSLVGEGERGIAQSLVLVDIAPRIEREGSERIRAFMTSAPNGFRSLQEAADAVHAYNPHRPRPSNLDGLTKNVRQRDDGRWYWHWDPRFMRIGDEPARAEGDARLYRAARHITVPTLLVRGTESDIVSPEGVAELLELIPSSQSVEVVAGHMVAGDDNDIFSRHLLGFLAAPAIPLTSRPAQ